MNLRTTFLAAGLLLALAQAQITTDPANFTAALNVPAGATQFDYRGAQVRIDTLAGLLYTVRYEGPRTAYGPAGEVIGAAIGDPGIQQPFEDWMKQNGERIDQETKPLVVGLGDAYTLTFLPGANLTFVVGPKEAPDSAFGAPRHVLGSGPVAIREYSDFECPACQALFNRALDQIKTRYVETGRARFEYRHFPLFEIHKQAVAAAEASECAADQDRFWEYHDALFRGGVGNYVGLAKQLDLDVGRFAECIANRTYRDVVEAHRAEAEALGLRGTPSVFVGPFLLPNPFDVDSYDRYLRMAKAKSAR